MNEPLEQRGAIEPFRGALGGLVAIDNKIVKSKKLNKTDKVGVSRIL